MTLYAQYTKNPDVKNLLQFELICAVYFKEHIVTCNFVQPYPILLNLYVPYNKTQPSKSELHLSLYVQYMFHSEILASLNFNKNIILSPGLENNHTLKCCSGNFPTLSYMSRLLEKYEINIWMYGYTQIQGTRSKKMEKYGKNLSRTFNKNLDIVPWIGE